MNFYLLEKYIKKVKEEDVYNFLLKEGILIPSSDFDILYSHLKNDYKYFYSKKDFNIIIEILKNEVSYDTLEKIKELYKKYELVILKFLK